MCYSKARSSNRILTLLSLLLICLFTALGVYAQSKSKIEQIKTKEVIPKTTDRFKMVADVMDEFGGEAGSDSFKMKMSSGGQPSPIGISRTTPNRSLLAGYVWGAFVLHGDDNGDGYIDLADVVYEISYLYKGGPPAIPPEAGDCNCDGKHDLGDLVYKITYLYKNGPLPCDP